MVIQWHDFKDGVVGEMPREVLFEANQLSTEALPEDILKCQKGLKLSQDKLLNKNSMLNFMVASYHEIFHNIFAFFIR